MADGVSSDWTDMIDLENRTLKMKGVFEHRTTFSFDELQIRMLDGWREQNDPSESRSRDLDSGEQEKLLARKGLAAGMGLKDTDQDETETKRQRLDVGIEKKGLGAKLRTKAWLKLVCEYAPDADVDSEQVGKATGVGSRLKATDTGTRTGHIRTQTRRKWKQERFYDVRYRGVTEYMHATPLHEIQIIPCMKQTRGEPEGQKHPVPMTT